MDEDKTAEKKAEEVQTSESTPPVEEIKTPSEVTDTAEKPVKTPEETEDGPDTEQNKAFQRMRQEIKGLKQQLDDKKRKESVFEQLKPSYTSVDVQTAQEQLDVNRYIDPVTGQFQAYTYNQDVQKIIENNRVANQKTAAQTAYQTYDEIRAKE